MHPYWISSRQMVQSAAFFSIVWLALAIWLAPVPAMAQAPSRTTTDDTSGGVVHGAYCLG